MDSSIPIGNKVVLISGGAHGMGASHARTAIQGGARVVIGDVAIEEASALAAQLGDSCLAVELDVTSESSWLSAVRAADDRFGGLDALVNNAGILATESLEQTTPASWARMVAVNQTGVYLGMRAAVPALRARGGGSIVNISSTGGLVGYRDTFAYTATKWAVRGMSKAAALDLADSSIRVNSIHPGDIETGMIANPLPGSRSVPATSEIPLGRYGQPAEISHLVAFLISDFASYITGAEFTADGGYTSQ